MLSLEAYQQTDLILFRNILTDEPKPPMSPMETLKQLEALQVDIGRPTNYEGYPCASA